MQILHQNLAVSIGFFAVQGPGHEGIRGDLHGLCWPEGNHTAVIGLVLHRQKALCDLVEVTGSPSKIDAFVKLMQPFGILEMCRTGIVAIERGAETMFSQEV